MNNIISIIVPVYNTAQYLRQCLDSLINQTYSNIEIIAVNDGSPDGSISILQEYAQRDSRIVVIDKDNEGVSPARNDAMKLAAGDYFMFVDSDDWLELDACERLMQVVEEQNPDVIMYSYYREYADRSLSKRDIFPSDFIVFDQEQCRQLHRRHAGAIGEELAHPENFDALCSICTKLYRAEIIRGNDEIQFINNRIIGTYEDGLMNLFYYKYVKKAVFMDNPLYHYRKTNESSQTTRYKEGFHLLWANLFKIIKTYISQNNLGDDFTQGLRNRISLSIIGLGMNEMNSPKGYLHKYRTIRGFLSDKDYRAAIKSFDVDSMPFHWKFFFNCCKLNLTSAVMSLLIMINFLKSKV